MHAIIVLIYRNFLFSSEYYFCIALYTQFSKYMKDIFVFYYFSPKLLFLFWFMLFRAVQISKSNSILGLGNGRELLVVVSGENIKILHVGFYVFSIFFSFIFLFLPVLSVLQSKDSYCFFPLWRINF